MIEYSTTRLDAATPEMRQQLARLTFRGESMMRSDILDRRHCRHRIQLVLAYDTAKADGLGIVAWSSIWYPCNHDAGLHIPGCTAAPVYTYVSRAYRRRGIGKQLLSRAAVLVSRHNEVFKPTVFYHDDQSTAFFKDASNDVATLELVDIDDWA